MSDLVLQSTDAGKLRQLCTALASAAADTIGSLVGHPTEARPTELTIADAASLLDRMDRPCALVRCTLDQDPPGRWVMPMFEVADACAMAGMLLMTPDDVVAQRRTAGVLEGEDAEAFAEIGNAIGSAIGNVLREADLADGFSVLGHGIVGPHADPQGLLPGGPLVVCRLTLQLGPLPTSTAALLIDRPLAETWNQAPLVATDGAAMPRPGNGPHQAESLEDIPAAPLRGTLNAYLALADCLPVLRRSCRRVGLDLRRHQRTEIPNPAAHRGEIVLLDVPAGEERRFEWCRRIKDFDKTTRVVLVLHRPSRARVAQAFLSQADLILGLPLDEHVLSQKLDSLFVGG